MLKLEIVDMSESSYEASVTKEAEQNVAETFVPRFVKVFNECKSYSIDTKVKNVAKEGLRKIVYHGAPESEAGALPSLKKVTFAESGPFREQWQPQFGPMEINTRQSKLCKGLSIKEVQSDGPRKKLVRTNTDSTIMVPKLKVLKIQELEDPYQINESQESLDYSETSSTHIEGLLGTGLVFK